LIGEELAIGLLPWVEGGLHNVDNSRKDEKQRDIPEREKEALRRCRPCFGFIPDRLWTMPDYQLYSPFCPTQGSQPPDSHLSDSYSHHLRVIKRVILSRKDTFRRLWVGEY